MYLIYLIVCTKLATKIAEIQLRCENQILQAADAQALATLSGPSSNIWHSMSDNFLPKHYTRVPNTLILLKVLHQVGKITRKITGQCPT